MPVRRKTRRFLVLVVLLGLGASAFLGLSHLAIESAARGRVFHDAEGIEHRSVGLVLGCVPVLADGRDNLFFLYRIAAARDLYQAGKVDLLLVSGDNHRRGYDEPTAMKEALVKAGVPAERVVCDYAGFRTLDSVVRARQVFGQSRLTVISQPFHNKRAIYLARHHGVDLIGYAARDVRARGALRTRLREVLARAKAVLDVRLFGTRPRFLGDPVTLPFPADKI